MDLQRLPGDAAAAGGPVERARAVVAPDPVDLLDGGHADGRPEGGGGEGQVGRSQQPDLMYMCRAMEAART